MAKEICISSTPHETRLAILEDDQLAEIYYERENEYTLAGSIYNGRVTRVLPGMQSAFVDVGLERDAFLYVTDFLELEDQEETDELEKAPASSPTQPPREVRHGGARNGQPQERPAREPRPGIEIEPASTEAEFYAPAAHPASEPKGDSQEESGEPGAKRWRGRRRGGRSGSAADTRTENGLSPETEPALAEQNAPQESHEIHASAVRTPRPHRAPAPFVLPGEALSKYGAVPAETEKKATESARPTFTSKPSTLIDAPLAWDGSGLLPGESISRHRTRQPEEEPAVQGEPEGVFADAANADSSNAVFEEQFEEVSQELPPQFEEGNSADEEFIEETLVDEGVIVDEKQAARAPAPDATVAASGSVVHESSTQHETHRSTQIHESDESSQVDGDEPEGNASASHHVDPMPPSGFRLFGFGGKNKKDDEVPPPQSPEPTHAKEPKPAAVSVASTFAPGSGLVEEEVIEGEEFDVPLHRHAHKHDEHDLDEYEEETLQTQIRSGELGEMLQEAHLDHRIQMNFNDKAVAEAEEG